MKLHQSPFFRYEAAERLDFYDHDKAPDVFGGFFALVVTDRSDVRPRDARAAWLQRSIRNRNSDGLASSFRKPRTLPNK